MSRERATRRWRLWNQPPSVIVYRTLVTATAATVTVETAAIPAKSDLFILAALVFMGIVQAELGRRIERVRRRIAGAVHINMTSVWILPAILLLPQLLTAVLVAVLHAHLHVRSWYRQKQVSRLRTAYNIGMVVLTCYITGFLARTTGVQDAREAIHAGWAGIAAITIAVGGYLVVNAALVIPGLRTGGGGTRDLIGSWADNMLEVATLSIGALVAVALATLPVLAVLVIPTVYLLHRAVLIDQLESAARVDSKTGVWNIAGWHRIARTELLKDDVAFGVLMVDLDHFKQVNDTHGHLAGDTVLKTVAETITANIRGCDAVGRFGGEEFVVLLPGLTEIDVRAVAERIRTAITRIEIKPGLADRDHMINGITASIGIATYPTSGTAIDRLLHVADTAMYRAKANGRNQVAS